eukprot:TRINITY_DN6975_c0_g4_i5.p1 TRINITY_DN6975_c0_g4~~TRINITY_DN6975_c0_g4_i5.p1  ORF type:complete len:204 (+),score=36.67 TRINITY_DN6975_c0_g4_i5:62-613(+)
MSSDHETILQLTDDKIPLGDLVERVSYASCGAVATFSGTTRDNFGGKEVVELFYEAYDEMALKEMAKIAAAVRAKWEDVRGIVIVHRKGLVPVKEASVVIVVSSPHRGASMDAVKFIINTLKETVPIWKKEIYSSGLPSWKQNAEFLTSDVMTSRQNTQRSNWGLCVAAAGVALALVYSSRNE